MNQTCGTCRHWNPGEINRAGSLMYKSVEPTCKQRFKGKKPLVRYAEQGADCWLWKEADVFDTEIRRNRGIIGGE